MKYPVLNKYKITQGFGRTPFSKKSGDEIYYFFGGKHPGLDFAMPAGEPVFAALPGYVTSVEYHRGMGKTIRIRYGNLQHIYGHLSKFEVDFGNWVKEGQKIGLSGNSISWGKPHLHFELRDSTVYEVKDRPIKPDFDSDLPKEFKTKWTYIANRGEAIIDLAIKFFGSEMGLKILKGTNPNLKRLASHYMLPIGSRINIPLK